MVTVELYVEESVSPKANWRWRLRASNGKITACSGESFDCKSKALRASRAVRKSLHSSYCVYERVIEKKEGSKEVPALLERTDS